MLVIHINSLLHLILRTKEHPTTIMNMLRQNRQQSLAMRINRQPTRILKHHRHGRTLVQNTQFSLGTLLVCRIGKNTTIQQRTIRISNHAANVTSAVRLAAFAGVFEAVEVIVYPVIPVHASSFVDGVDGARAGMRMLGWVRMNSPRALSRVKPLTVPPRMVMTSWAEAPYMVKPEATSSVPREDVLGGVGLACARGLVGELENAEDGADGDTSVEVG